MIPDKMEEPETGSELLKTTEVAYLYIYQKCIKNWPDAEKSEIPDKMEEPETGSELLKTTEVPTDSQNIRSGYSMNVGPLLPRACVRAGR